MPRQIQQHSQHESNAARAWPESFTQRELIAIEAMEWLGTPFRHQGRLKGIGCDCIGLIIGIGRKFGYDKTVNFREFLDYSKSPDGKVMKEQLRKYLDPIELSQAMLADIIHFAPIGIPQHVGMLMHDNHVIHASQPDGKIVEQNLTGWLGTKRIAAYRFRGL